MSGAHGFAATLRNVLSGLRGSGGNRLVIITYHRVLPERDQLLPDEPTADEFSRQMQILASAFTVLPLAEAVECMYQRTLPKRAIAITFDDGYRNNYDIAMPILARQGLQATFFVAASYLGAGTMWNDRIIEAVRQCCTNSVRLMMAESIELNLATQAHKRDVINRLLSFGKYLSFAEREKFASHVEQAAGAPAAENLMMTPEQVGDLTQRGFEVGAHTMKHPILTRVRSEEAEAEITDGKRVLEQISNNPVKGFAYPNGVPDKDYNQTHVQMVRRAGFEYAVSTRAAYASCDTHRFEIPRMSAYGKDAIRFGTNILSTFGQT